MKENAREAGRARSEDAGEEDEEGAPGKLASLKANVDRVTSSASLALEVAGLKTPTRTLGKKRLLLSGLLSFFFGPFGWLYAAPLKEAIPVILVYSVIVWAFWSSFLMMYIAGLVSVVSAIAGVLYAWGFNSAGKRVPLLLKEKDGADPPVRKLLSSKKR